jgi:diguanylate cyclase (GGDEF)-like protein/putative nucleotidyltransferase with HDIG domain
LVLQPPAIEAATCHVGETVDPERNVPRAMFASGFMATIYFAVLPVIWLGALGTGPLGGDLSLTLGPTFAPILGSVAKGAAIWFMMFNMFHGTMQPLAGAARTLMQIAEDGLLPRIFTSRTKTDAPLFTTWLTALSAIIFLWIGDPPWLIAAANLTYLIGICLPNVAVWLLRRDAPDMHRPYRAPRGTITLGLIAAFIWGISTVLGFEQFGLPTVIAGMAFAYSGSGLYAWRRWEDIRRSGQKFSLRSMHVKLTGAMLLVLTMDAIGYLLAINSVNAGSMEQITALEDIFVGVALLTITVGLVLPGMIAHATREVAMAAQRLAHGTLADLSQAMKALESGQLEQARADIDIVPVIVHSQDELEEMAQSFNVMQDTIVETAHALDGAREGLRNSRDALQKSNEQLACLNEELEQRVRERTSELQVAHDELAALATTDPLTGLPNHRALVSALDQEIGRAQRFNCPFSLLFFDIDHFKALNDTCGHAGGDAVLSEIGTCINAHLRDIDIIGRWGGEEFIVLLPGTNLDGAIQIAERIRAAVERYPFGISGSIHLTISIGAVTYPSHASDRATLIDAADHAMYLAKKLGRNQVCSAEDLARYVVNDHNQSREWEALEGAVSALTMLLGASDRYTGEHTDEVAELASCIAQQMNMSPTDLQIVKLAGKLHDIGKIAIPDAILNKPGPLTDEEWAIMRTHPVVGAEAISSIPFLRMLAPAIRSHHERWDGKGYPDGFVGNDIPLIARIITVADAYNAITTDRPYRKARSPEIAISILRENANTQFDPTILAVLEDVLSKSDPRAA